MKSTAMRPKWGVHPVLEAALAYLEEDDVPRDIENALPGPGRLSTKALVSIALLCLEHLRPRVGRRQRPEFERLAGLAAREFAAGQEPLQREPWHDELHHAHRDFEHARGAVKIAALAAEIAGADVLRHAPSAGREAAALTVDLVRRTAKELAGDDDALHAFVRALCEAVGKLQTTPSARGGPNS